MSKQLNYFLETIWLEKEKIQEIISNPELKTIEDKVKSSVLFVLDNNPKVYQEKEIKILGINYWDIIEKLIKLWAIETFNGWIEDNRYDFKGKLKKVGILLRTREVKGKKTITLKKRNISDNSIYSNAQELEIEINNINYLLFCFNNIWLNIVKWKQYRKHRMSYELNWVHFDFDKIDWRSRVLEIESDSNEAVNEWIIKLHLENNEKIGDWYNDYINMKMAA